VSAGVITIHFPSDLASPCLDYCRNTTADGFRISPNWHYDTVVIQNTPQMFVPGIGWDSEPGGGMNPDYLGKPFPPFSSIASVYVDYNGIPFNLLSLESLGEAFSAESSKGAIVSIPDNHNPPSALHFDFVGPEWRDIQWVLFFYGNPGLPVAGFDQLVTSVPGPPTVGLFGLGVLILGWRFRSSMRPTTRPSP